MLTKVYKLPLTYNSITFIFKLLLTMKIVLKKSQLKRAMFNIFFKNWVKLQC